MPVTDLKSCAKYPLRSIVHVGDNLLQDARLQALGRQHMPLGCLQLPLPHQAVSNVRDDILENLVDELSECVLST